MAKKDFIYIIYFSAVFPTVDFSPFFYFLSNLVFYNIFSTTVFSILEVWKKAQRFSGDTKNSLLLEFSQLPFVGVVGTEVAVVVVVSAVAAASAGAARGRAEAVAAGV
jgi:hypothetical protein